MTQQAAQESPLRAHPLESLVERARYGNGLAHLARDLPPLLTLREAADFCRMKVQALRDSVHKGLLPAYRLGPNTRMLVSRDELIRTLQRVDPGTAASTPTEDEDGE